MPFFVPDEKRNRKHSILCYDDIKIDQDDKIDVNDLHNKTVEGYIRLSIKSCAPKVIIIEIQNFYAKPLIMNININDEMKYILYCPVDDDWDTLTKKINQQFLFPDTSKKYNTNRKIQSIIYLSGNGSSQKTFYQTDWNENTLLWDEGIKSVFKPIMIDTGYTYQLYQWYHKNESGIHHSNISNKYLSNYYHASYPYPRAIKILRDKLKQFDKIAIDGQLFLRYTRNEDIINTVDVRVKVAFNDRYRPIEILGVEFKNILYISWGHWTPIFQERKDELDACLCFSIVAKDKIIIDLQAENGEIAELWVKGLRRLIGVTDDKMDELAMEAMRNGWNEELTDKDDMISLTVTTNIDVEETKMETNGNIESVENIENVQENMHGHDSSDQQETGNQDDVLNAVNESEQSMNVESQNNNGCTCLLL